MNYFGTDLRMHGHYRWEILNGSLVSSRLGYDQGLPFNPEETVKDSRKGSVAFLQEEGHSVMTITGSCTDKRGGTKSVFWLPEIVSYEELKDRILSIPIFVEMIEKMDFRVRWR